MPLVLQRSSQSPYLRRADLPVAPVLTRRAADTGDVGTDSRDVRDVIDRQGAGECHQQAFRLRVPHPVFQHLRGHQ